MSINIFFDKSNLDNFLEEFSIIYKSLGNNIPVEIILVGGASVLANYNFRKTTNDVDAVIPNSSVFKKAIKITGKKLGLEEDWLNMEFKKSKSYTEKLNEVSKYYKTFSDIIKIRTINSEYLIAMKLKSGRRYKNDLSDIIGITYEHKKNNNPITLESVKNAAITLYGSWENIPESSRNFFINDVLKCNNLEELYSIVKKEEEQNNKIIKEIKKENPGRLVALGFDKVLDEVKERLSSNEKKVIFNDITELKAKVIENNYKLYDNQIVEEINDLKIRSKNDKQYNEDKKIIKTTNNLYINAIRTKNINDLNNLHNSFFNDPHTDQIYKDFTYKNQRYIIWSKIEKIFNEQKERFFPKNNKQVNNNSQKYKK
jgi:hypothetical protein